jgi:hypothetical protein
MCEGNVREVINVSTQPHILLRWYYESRSRMDRKGYYHEERLSSSQNFYALYNGQRLYDYQYYIDTYRRSKSNAIHGNPEAYCNTITISIHLVIGSTDHPTPLKLPN